MTREYRYLLLDVFTDKPLLGNPLAVFLDGNGLSDAEMQMLARETNLSETTFCFPGQEADKGSAAVRIFTTQEELPFAGHPTLGTAAALRMTLPALQDATQIALRLPLGTVVVRFARGAEEPSAAGSHLPFGRPLFCEMEQPLPVFGDVHPAKQVAAALNIPIEALDRDKPVQTVSTGLPFVVTPLVSQQALRGLTINHAAAADFLRASDGKFFYVLAPGRTPAEWHARMPLYAGEDPATGSAAGCAIAYLVGRGYVPSATSLVIYQGEKIGRRSLLHVTANLIPGADTHCAYDKQALWKSGSYIRVGGSTVLVAEGRFFLP